MWLILLFILGGVQGELSGKKVLFIVAPKNFRDEEYFEPKKVLEEKGAVVITASLKKRAKGMLGAKIEVDTLISQVKGDAFDGVVFVGGTGCVVYFDNDDAKRIIEEAYNAKKIIGAICLAPCILAKAGILKGKEATGYDCKLLRKIFKEEGVKYTGKEVEITGLIVTAYGPAVAKQFGLTLYAMLKH